MGFKDWLEWRVPDDAIKIRLPKVNQTTGYSCGAAALRAVASYFGVSGDEDKFIDLIGTTEEGSSPDQIVAGVKKLGLHVQSRTGMSIDDLVEYLSNGIPVICAIQAWGETKKYDSNDNGHYVVAIGFDKDHIYFEDPSMHNGRGYLVKRTFLRRWHDQSADGRSFKRLGIAIWDSVFPDKESDENKVRPIP